ncbi:large ATP-binding protein [Streptomyces sp. SID4985]|uniref:large ATP-binding protein n=1 Tax=Streptomyces sp. SID4985 TaxID=2690292 RepID=UPI00136DE347|nr:large ATP-binding protein [Streptomyces sp. SID4985]MYQ48733.1 large ATP-binding protein [Streptomyces sp. SID4985]
MNPYDANTHPGPHLVAETLGVSDVGTLNLAHRRGEPLYGAAIRVMQAAHNLDERHGRVTHAARYARRLLEPLARGELDGARVSYAMLQTAVPELGDLLAQQDRAHDQLVESVFAYQRLLPGAGAAKRSEAVVLGRPAPTPDVQGTSLAEPTPSPEQLQALEVIKRSRAWLKERVVRAGLRVATDAGSRRIDLATVMTMYDARWGERDTNTTLRLGQRLALTALGEAVFRAGCATDLRVAAALRRGASTKASPCSPTNPPPSPSGAKHGRSL